jgi:hypothetical protein
MNVYTAARIEIAAFSVLAFGAGYYWPSWEGALGAAFLVWVGLTMIKDEWDERKLAKERRMLSERLTKKLRKRSAK